MFDLVEEPFNEIALSIEELTEANRVFAVGLGRDVRPCVAFGDGLAQRVGVVALIGDENCAGGQVDDEVRRAGDVALLARRQLQLDRPALLVDKRVDFGREPAPRATQTAIRTPLFAVAPC